MWAPSFEIVGVVADDAVAGIPAADSVEQAVVPDVGGVVVVGLIVAATAASGIEVDVIVVESDGGVGRIVVGSFLTPDHGPVTGCGRIDPAIGSDLYHLYPPPAASAWGSAA